MKKLFLIIFFCISFNTVNSYAKDLNYEEEMEKIEYLKEENKEKYLIEYKNIIEKYSNEIDPPKTIYDVTTNNEFYFLAQVVETEIEGGSFEQKVNVASSIINRVKSDNFPNTFTEVLKQKKQYTPVLTGAYKYKKPTQSTIHAIEYAYMIEDTTNGATYFHSGKSSWHKNNLNFIFDDGKHKFYN